MAQPTGRPSGRPSRRRAKAGRGEGERGFAAVDIAARNAEALRLRYEERLTLREIGERMGVDHPEKISRMIDQAVAKVPAEHAIAHRNTVLNRYEYLWRGTQDEIERDNIAVSQGQAVLYNGKPVLDRMPNIAARRVATQILKGIREVTGVDAPSRKVVETVSSDIWARKLAELEAEVAANDGVAGPAAAGDSAADSRVGEAQAGEDCQPRPS